MLVGLGCDTTYVVLGLLVFVSLLVSGRLLLVWLTLLLAECLPLVTEDFADLACSGRSVRVLCSIP